MDFVILKVNGQDLSGATHEEAVEAFRRAKEPIIVQVVRQGTPPAEGAAAAHAAVARPLNIPPPPLKPLPQVPVNEGKESSAAGHCCRSSRQPIKCPTNSPHQHKLAQAALLLSDSHQRHLAEQHKQQQKAAPPTVSHWQPPPLQFPLQFFHGIFPASSPIEIAATEADDEFYNALDDFDYEEVTLNRSSAGEKLGLTLCYSSADSGAGSPEPVTEVFVGEVDPLSVAGRCCRIREGDQILSINGQPVRTRAQAVCLFAAAEQSVTLLLARAAASAASDSSCLDDLHVEMMELRTEEPPLASEPLPEADEEEEEEEEVHQDSGVSSTQSSEQEVEELAAALTKLRHGQQAQQRWVPKMGTRLQRGPIGCSVVARGAASPVGAAPTMAARQQQPQGSERRPQQSTAACQTVKAGDSGGCESARQRRSPHRHRQPAPQDPPPPPPQQQQPQMEWVVKRRADGSRYVTRRPVRSRLLKARAAQVAEERAGLTTDDDVASCIGRWAPRHERKRQLRRQQPSARGADKPVSVTFV